MSYYSIYNITADFTIKVTGEVKGTRAITYTNLDMIKVSHGSATSLATIGSKFELYYGANDGYHLTDAATITGVTPTTNTLNYGSGSIVFTVPEEDEAKTAISISFAAEANGTISYESNDGIDSVSFKLSTYGQDTVTTAAPNATVYVFPTAKSGYLIADIKMNGTSIVSSYSSYNKSYYFTMPASGDAKITFEVGTAHSVSADTVTGGSISFNSGISFAAGSTVNFSVSTTNAFYTLDKVVEKTHTDLVITMNGIYGSFTMPDYDVVLVPSFTKTEGVTIAFTLPADSSSVKSVSIYGAKSHSSLSYRSDSTSNVMSSEFLPDETLTASVGFTSTKYNAKVVITDTEDHTYDPSSFGNSYSSYNSIDYKVNSATKSITLSIYENTPLTATISNTATSATLTYKVNGNAVDNLDSIYAGDSVAVTATGTPADGKYFSLVATKTDGGTELSTASGGDNTTLYFNPQAAFTLTIAEKSYAKCTVVGPEDLTGHTENVSLSLSFHYSTVSDITKLLPGASNYYTFNFYNNYSEAIDVTVTMEGMTTLTYNLKASGTYPYSFNANFAVTGDVTITWAFAA